ncbi:MAG: hypothetical protein KIS61_18460 [Candidatus Eremiobacteraeota bacterium]|nr:hypothetical protein [Candidatus Eremiobacteraeota bacterium]
MVAALADHGPPKVEHRREDFIQHLLCIVVVLDVLTPQVKDGTINTKRQLDLWVCGRENAGAKEMTLVKNGGKNSLDGLEHSKSASQ